MERVLPGLSMDPFPHHVEPRVAIRVRGRLRGRAGAVTLTVSTKEPNHDTAPPATVTGAHLVGSVNLPSAEDVFGAVSEHLGGHITHIPDGEVGERFYWLQFQTLRFDRTPGLVRVGAPRYLIRGQFDQRLLALDGTVAAEDLRFPDLGYAAAAIESFATFARLQRRGASPPGTRFQVSLPTPAAVVGVFIAPQDRAAIEPVYTRALYAELDRISAALPHDAFQIQWDTAVELALARARRGRRLRDARRGGTTCWRGCSSGSRTPPPTCRRTCRSASTSATATWRRRTSSSRRTPGCSPPSSAACSRGRRTRSPTSTCPCRSSATTTPTSRRSPDLEVPEGTDLYLGLVHHEDGVDGALRRIDAASTVLSRFGIGTECGFGRGPAERTVPLLDLHRADHRGRGALNVDMIRAWTRRRPDPDRCAPRQ